MLGCGQAIFDRLVTARGNAELPCTGGAIRCAVIGDEVQRPRRLRLEFLPRLEAHVERDIEELAVQVFDKEDIDSPNSANLKTCTCQTSCCRQRTTVACLAAVADVR
jgi:hypothetical protein